MREQDADPSNQLHYSDSAKEIIARALKGKPMSDNYDFKRVDHLV